MNIQLPGKPKGYNVRIIAYIIIFIICVFAVGVAIYQFFANEKLGVIVGVTNSNSEEIEELKTKFNTIFTNCVEVEQSANSNENKENYQNFVYTTYKKQDKSSNNYDLNVNIPSINSNSDLAIKCNSQIKENFEEPAKYIQQTKSRNILYTVDYIAYIKDNILSLAILSTFKEGNSAQRTMIKTYNYDLLNNTEVKLDDLIQKKNIERNQLENKIELEIKKAQEQTEELRKMGYEIYSRNKDDNMYQLDNTTEFFIYKDHLYLVYAYGNNNNTSEMDLIII